MHKIERRPSGFVLTFAGNIDAKEMKTWVDESTRALTSVVGAFSVVVDMKALAPLQPDAQAVMVQGQQLFKAKGMIRSAVIVSNAVTALQFQRLAKTSGIYAWERYFDGSRPTATAEAVAWAKDAVDPDKA